MSKKLLSKISDVVDRIERNIYNENIAEALINKVEHYVETGRQKDDITNQEANLIYRNVDFDDTSQLSKKRKLDIDWTGHGKYRSELRDIDHNRVNDETAERMHEILINPKKRKKNKKVLKEDGVGHIVVDYDLTVKPSEADIVTVYARKGGVKISDKIKAIAESLNLIIFDNDGVLEVHGSRYGVEKFFSIVKKFIKKSDIRFLVSSELKLLRKKMANRQVVDYNVQFTGKVKIDRKKDDEWGCVEVDNAIRKSIVESLRLSNKFKIPTYKAHLSLFDSEEVKQLPAKIEEEGGVIRFTLDNVEVCDPEGWDEVSELYMVTCSSTDMEALRAKYGFSPKMNENKHEFHITLAIKENK